MAEEKPESRVTTKEEDLALEELLAGEQVPDEAEAPNEKAAEEVPSDEEAQALEELLSGETPAHEDGKDEEDAALDELLAVSDSEGGAPIEQETPVSDDSKDETDAAREEPVANEDRGESAPADKGADDGVITLNEVVALGGMAAKEDQSGEDDGLGAGAAEDNLTDEGVSDLEAIQTDDVETAGLSREERDDLDKLIKGLKEEQPSAAFQAAISDLEKQVKAMRKRVVQLSKLMKQHDKKMRSYDEIMRLFFKKSELMNQRIETMTNTRKGRKKA